ncbi:MAG: hypothetical protein HYS13_15160 [Planctomycetia bacterium]|nr:hypothetical protein [Planctomycetia bacterium]
MSTVNPYASPHATPDAAPPAALGQVEGLWSDGPWLVVRRGAKLPDVCVKTNEVAIRRLRHDFARGWSLGIPLSEQVSRRRLRIPLSVYAMVVIFVAALIGGTVGLNFLDRGSDHDSGPWMAAWFIALAALVVAAVVIGWRAVRVLRMVKTEGDYLWLSGVNPSYLAALPPWPPQDGPRSVPPAPIQHRSDL